MVTTSNKTHVQPVCVIMVKQANVLLLPVLHLALGVTSSYQHQQASVVLKFHVMVSDVNKKCISSLGSEKPHM